MSRSYVWSFSVNAEKRVGEFGSHGWIAVSSTNAKPRAGIRDSVMNDHSAVSFHGFSSVPGATGAPGGSGASKPRATCTLTGSVFGSAACRYLRRNSSHEIGGGFGSASGPNGSVTDPIAKSTVTVPCSGGPSTCSVAPTDTLIVIVTQPMKHTSSRKPRADRNADVGVEVERVPLREQVGVRV